ncbi:hypothetical protein [uncultured Desulfobacter sp.]|uniref:hypothetical protein n=1 Tax=uncultured Desulfobacter sp. TaxID=240139 RepID=UPI0029F4A259|nr:hypothetical protein [uncultured Desulfobacter sp.]
MSPGRTVLFPGLVLLLTLGFNPSVFAEPVQWDGEDGNNHSGSARWVDKALDLLECSFEKLYVRGDTDFNLTTNFDKWDQRCTFIFGMDARKNLIAKAKSGRRVFCAADFMEAPRQLLEAQRKMLYEKMPVPLGWHQDYEQKKADTQGFQTFLPSLE